MPSILHKFFGRRREDKKVMQKVLEKTYSNRFWITLFTLATFAGLMVGIGYALFNATVMPQEWKEILLLMIGAFIGSYQRIFDFWFNSVERDKEIMYRADAEDGILTEKIAPFHGTVSNENYGPDNVWNNVPQPNVDTPTSDGVCNCMCEGCRKAHNKDVDNPPLVP